MRKREDSWKKQTFSLSLEAIEKLKDGANFHHLKNSRYIEFLIMRESETLDPIKQFENSSKKIKELREKLKEEENKNSQIAKKLTDYQKWIKQKQDKKPEAIRILQRMIVDKRYQDAERVAKTWGVMLGISPMELLFDANKIK